MAESGDGKLLGLCVECEMGVYDNMDYKHERGVGLFHAVCHKLYMGPRVEDAVRVAKETQVIDSSLISHVARSILEQHVGFLGKLDELMRIAERIELRLAKGETRENIGLCFSRAEELEFGLRAYLSRKNPDPLYTLALADLPSRYPLFMRQLGRAGEQRHT